MDALAQLVTALSGREYPRMSDISCICAFPWPRVFVCTYARSLSSVTYTTALFARTDICPTCLKRGKFELRRSRLPWDSPRDIQIANSASTTTRGGQSPVELTNSKLSTMAKSVRWHKVNFFSSREFEAFWSARNKRARAFQVHIVYVTYVRKRKVIKQKRAWKTPF